MNKTMMMGAAAMLVASVAQAAIIQPATQADITAAEVVAPAGMGVIKAVNFNGTADTVGSVSFEADTWDGTDGNGYSSVGTVTTEGSGVLNSSFVNNDNAGFFVGTLTGLATDMDYAFDLFVGTAHNARNSTLSYSIGTESGSFAYDQVGIDLRRIRVEFNTGSDTTFDWSVGNVGTGGYHSKLAGYAVYAVPEPATLGMVALFGGGILFIRRRFMI